MDLMQHFDEARKEYEGLERLKAAIEELEPRTAPEGETVLPM